MAGWVGGREADALMGKGSSDDAGDDEPSNDDREDSASCYGQAAHRRRSEQRGEDGMGCAKADAGIEAATPKQERCQEVLFSLGTRRRAQKRFLKIF